MIKYFWGTVVGFTSMALLLFASSAEASDAHSGAKSPHVNIAIFHTLQGQGGFQFPEKIAAMNILQAVQGKAQFIIMNHAAGLKDGDVVSIASDVLRAGDDEFEDFGVDCQFSIHIKGDGVSIGGMCEIMIMDQDGRIVEHKGFVKPFAMQAGEDWQLIYYDAKDGIAVYADENIGQE